VRGFREGAVAGAVLLAALVARRQDFGRRSDPEAQPRVTARAVTAVTFLYGYGAVALWINRLVLDEPFSALLALRETTAALLGCL
jgi:hypothetical protein